MGQLKGSFSLDGIDIGDTDRTRFHFHENFIFLHLGFRDFLYRQGLPDFLEHRRFHVDPPKAALGNTQINIQVSGFGFQNLAFADA
jgi:hypothetical protein